MGGYLADQVAVLTDDYLTPPPVHSSSLPPAALPAGCLHPSPAHRHLLFALITRRQTSPATALKLQ